MKSLRMNITAALMIAAVLAGGCKKEADEFKSMLDGKEVIYPGRMQAAAIETGNKRVELSWLPSTDPSIRKHRIFWNNGQDSLDAESKITDPSQRQRIVINGVNEGTQTFAIYSFDDLGNRSTRMELANIRVYGDVYRSELSNRASSGTSLNGGKLVTHWFTPDTVNVKTDLMYTSVTGAARTLELGPDVETLELPDWKPGTLVYYRSFYRPYAASIDTFGVTYRDSLEYIYPYEGNYTAVGTRYNYSADGTLVGSVAINLAKQLGKTNTRMVYESDDIANLANYANSKMTLTIHPENNTIDVSGYISGTNPIADHPTAGKSYFDPATGQLVLRYKYTNADGSFRLIEEVWTK
jgi:hypothetical protein